MGSNDPVLIDQLIKQRNSEVGNNIPETDFFEIFASEQILKNSDLSYDEIKQGIA